MTDPQPRPPSLTHFAADGRPVMVDVGDKPSTARRVIASGRVRMHPQTLERALTGGAKKGDVALIAEIAGIQAAKQTSQLIPLCHPIALTKVSVVLRPDPALPGFTVEAIAATHGPTGVEMEALTAVSVACLTIYDMLKAVDRDMVIDAIQLLEKDGGASGAYRRSEP
ncbi:MAG TPA: cyclic pyranopterin monophosphate synthase MoaC [Hyphomonadaceae bacterium]|nr:cyclic pyranopterin monophosphate synthase MoaC [Hyphomonadaceae bacterium]